MNRSSRIFTACIALAALVATATLMLVAPMGRSTPHAFALRWWAIDPGTTTMRGADYTLAGVPGQTETSASGGNYTVIGGAMLEPAVSEIAVSGLRATCDSITALGTTTHFHAEVDAGTSVQFFWDYGDGVTGLGSDVEHLYGTSGSYVVTVTATNSLNSISETMTVIVLPLDEIELHYLPLVLHQEVEQ